MKFVNLKVYYNDKESYDLFANVEEDSVDITDNGRHLIFKWHEDEHTVSHVMINISGIRLTICNEVNKD